MVLLFNVNPNFIKIFKRFEIHRSVSDDVVWNWACFMAVEEVMWLVNLPSIRLLTPYRYLPVFDTQHKESITW